MLAFCLVSFLILQGDLRVDFFNVLFDHVGFQALIQYQLLPSAVQARNALQVCICFCRKNKDSLLQYDCQFFADKVLLRGLVWGWRDKQGRIMRSICLLTSLYNI